MSGTEIIHAAITDIATADGQVPSEFKIFPVGQISLQGDDPVSVDPASIDEMVRRFTARGLDMVIDYEHQTEGGDYASPDGIAPAAGWVKRLENRGEQGLWAVVEWTERAKTFLASREYRYFSPVFLVTKAGRKVVELLRLALTNAPKLNHIKPLVARTQTAKENATMDFLKLCANKLGLGDDADQQQVLDAIEQMVGAQNHPPVQVACKNVLAALDLAESSSESEVVATIHAMKQSHAGVADVTRELASLKQKLAERDRDDLVTAAVKDGKITPAQREWAEAYALRDAEGFKLFVAKAPQVVPVSPSAPHQTAAKTGDELDAATLQVARMFGNTPDMIKKYRG